METLFDTMPNGVVFSRAIVNEQNDVVDFQVVDCNEAICQMTGFSRSYMRARTMRQQDPAAEQSGIFERWRQAYLSGKLTRFLHYFGGADVWFEQSLSRFEEGIIACFTDVTYLKRSEMAVRRHADLLEQIGRSGQMAIAVVEAVREEDQIVDFRYTFCNEQAATWLDSKPDDVLGMSLYSLNRIGPSSELDKHLVLHRQVVETGKTMAHDILLPGERTFHTVCNRLGDGMIITAIDVTSARRIATRHERLNKTLQKQNDLLAAVLSQVRCGVSVHDAVLDENDQLIDFKLRLQNDYMKDLRWQAFRETMSPGELFNERFRETPAAQPFFELMQKAYTTNRQQQLKTTSSQGIPILMLLTRFGQSVLTTINEVT